MSDDTDLKMFEIKAELAEIKCEMETLRKENTDLKNNMAFSNLMEKVDDFQRNNYNRFGAMEEQLKALTITVSNNNEALAEIKGAIQAQKENEKSLVDDHAKLSETVGAIKANVTTLSTKVSSSNQTSSIVNESLRKKKKNLRKANKIVRLRTEVSNKFGEVDKKLTDHGKDIDILKNKKIMEKETILLLGGTSDDRVVDSLLLLDNNGESDENWKELNIKLPYEVYDHGAQFLNNYLYIFGGQNKKHEVLNLSYKLTRGHKLLTNNSQWNKIKDMNEKRSGISNSSVILNGQIWVIGGYNEEGTLKSVEMYDPQRNIWTSMTEMNQCRGLAAAAVVNGKIFCCGGYDRKNFLKSVECYDPSSDVWTFIADMPGPNGACGIVVMDAHLIVIGGMASPTHFLSSVLIWNTADGSGKWIEREPSLSRPRCVSSIAKIRDEIFVYGGCYIEDDDECCATADVNIFHGEVWRNGPSLTTSLCGTAAVVITMEFAKPPD